MAGDPVRRPAVAGSWYPARADALRAAIDAYCAVVPPPAAGHVIGLVSPHAGLVYSGPVAAHAFRQIAGETYDVVVLVGPSHYVGFDGVAVFPHGEFDTPLGRLRVSEPDAQALMAATPLIYEHPSAHKREHSLEMQLPFLARFLPDVPIVPLVMGYQTRVTTDRLAQALGAVLGGRRALLVASSDLSHYHDATVAAQLDHVVIDAVSRFDPDQLQAAIDVQPEHACGGGPMVAVMRAARTLGASQARILRYADSGDVSGDKSAVVGYLGAAFTAN
jgi:MEMO1 family protein